jgi:phosphoribosylglycinamide formyltransferase-1
MAKLKLAVLISGRGSNLQALIDACADEAFPAEITAVISNKSDAKGLERAKKAGITTHICSNKDYDDRAFYDAALHELILSTGADCVCLAGFMRLLTKTFVESWEGKMINIHPSLLPSFKGAHAHRDALAAGARISGCTVHFVTAEMDSGPIIVQASVPVHPDDDEESLGARVLEAEHQAYPLAIKLLAEEKVSMHNGKTRFRGFSKSTGLLLNPAN